MKQRLITALSLATTHSDLWPLTWMAAILLNILTGLHFLTLGNEVFDLYPVYRAMRFMPESAWGALWLFSGLLLWGGNGGVPRFAVFSLLGFMWTLKATSFFVGSPDVPAASIYALIAIWHLWLSHDSWAFHEDSPPRGRP